MTKRNSFLASFVNHTTDERMSPEELKALINQVEETLQSDLILSTRIGEEPNWTSIGLKKKCKYFGIRLLQAFGWIHQILVCYCCLTGSSTLSLYFIDMLHGMGSLGCIMSGCYLCGYTLLNLHLRAIDRQEKKQQLHLLTHMKISNKLDFTPEERKEYARNLKWMIVKNKLIFLTTGIPMTIFYLLGAVITGKQMKSWYFSIMSAFMLVMYAITSHNCLVIFANVHLMTALSRNYFEIRIRKIRVMIRDWIRQTTDHNKKYQSLNDITTRVENVLREIEQHNETIKYFLRDVKVIMGPMISMLIVFFASDAPWYLRFTSAGGSTLIVTAAVYSLYNASGLHLNLIKLSNNLHSCQVFQRVKNDADAKIKYHLLRLIHRTSSPHLPVGFTVRGTGSFTPGSAGFFVSYTISVSLIFLNTSK